MDPRAEVQRVVRQHYGWVLARLMRSVHDIDLAQDALQQALEAALMQWPRGGLPESPRAWLVAAAKNRAIDELRRRTLHANKEDEIAGLHALTRTSDDPRDDQPIRDDMLRLVFTCCHPALGREAQVALTLRTIAGLETEEIAKAFLVPVSTMAQRLVRAKTKIRVAQVPYVVPSAEDWGDRLAGVLAVVYLVFNEGYVATHGQQLIRRDLCRIAIGLGRELCEMMPDSAEVDGLLALMLLTDSRSEARTSPTGDLVLLEDQDRRRWDRAQIDEGRSLTKRAVALPGPGPYALQAAIAAVHAEASDASATDWPQIVALYGELFTRAPTAVVALNRAVAIAMAFGPERGLSEMASLEEALAGYYLYYSARADLLRRLGRDGEAIAEYRRAIAACQNETERRFLERRVRALAS